MTADDNDNFRFTVRVNRETGDQIKYWADAIGVRLGHFTSMALTYGARHLAEQYGVLNMVPVTTVQGDFIDTPDNVKAYLEELKPGGGFLVWGKDEDRDPSVQEFIRQNSESIVRLDELPNVPDYVIEWATKISTKV